MKWSNVKLILVREVRDQLRDRRTLFTIAVLPLLLYPLLGMTFLQVAQFTRQHPTKIWVIGTEELPSQPKLIEHGRFATRLCVSDEEADLLHVTLAANEPRLDDRADPIAAAEEAVQSGDFDAVIYFPPHFAQQLEQFRTQLPGKNSRGSEELTDLVVDVPNPQIIVDTAKDASRIAHDRVNVLLRRWREEIVRKNLEASKIPTAAAKPFEVQKYDVALEEQRRAVIWSKILPFIVLIWALTREELVALLFVMGWCYILIPPAAALVRLLKGARRAEPATASAAGEQKTGKTPSGTTGL